MRNLKKVIALVAVFAMMISTVAFAQTFSDVAEDHDYYEAIEMLSKLSILTGDDQDGDGVMDFRPNDTITRAEVAAIVSRIQGIYSAAQTSTQFVDVPSSHWASGYVAQAAGQGIVNGYGDGNFGPEDPVLYEQAVKMFMETLGYAPYVADAGGYPTGHLTAATRSGVLDGVIGGSIGAEATRGQIAQMVYNAIDTPLMIRSSYGADADYVIYDDADKDGFETLLTRDLGVKKFSGIVVANRFNDSLTAPAAIDMEEDEEIEIIADINNDYKNYNVEEVENATLFAGTSGAGELLGKHVNVLIREMDGSNDYEIVSIAESNKNRTFTVTLDLLDEYVYGETSMKYRKTANGSTDTLNNIAEEAAVIFNGVALDGDNLEAVLAEKDILSGQITFIDNGSKDEDKKSLGYSVIDVEVAVSAVVDEVTEYNVVLKEEVVGGTGDNSFGDIDFDEEDTSVCVVLTKNGQEIEYTELKEWDVLSILSNDYSDYYVVDVIDGGKIEGSITSSKKSTTSYDEKQYTIDGKGYDVAKNAYLSGKLEPGASGVFYVDAYGKIVAYDKNGTVNKASDKYAYVLAAKTEEDAWENSSVRVQILDKSGNIYDAYLADSVRYDNVAKGSDVADAIGLADTDFDKETGLASETKKTKDVADADALAALLVNKFITYSANTTGEIKGIAFAINGENDENSLTLYAEGAATYDNRDLSLRVGGTNYEVDESTLVFFISGGADEEVWVDGEGVVGTASKTASRVSTAGALSDDYDYAQVYDSEDDIANVIVIYNSTGGVSSATNIALIDSIGTGVLDGDTVTTVEYWMGGQKMTSAVSPDAEGEDLLPDEGEGKGSIYKFNVSEDGTLINEVRLIASYDRTKDAGAAGMPTLSLDYVAKNEAVYFGPLAKAVSSGKLTLATPIVDEDGDVTGYDFASRVTVKVDDANVYVLDANLRSNQIEVGLASDAKYVKNLVENIADPVVAKPGNAELVPADEDAFGLMDFVAAFEYDDDTIDIVVYKAYDFGKFSR